MGRAEGRASLKVRRVNMTALEDRRMGVELLGGGKGGEGKEERDVRCC